MHMVGQGPMQVRMISGLSRNDLDETELPHITQQQQQELETHGITITASPTRSPSPSQGVVDIAQSLAAAAAASSPLSEQVLDHGQSPHQIHMQVSERNLSKAEMGTSPHGHASLVVSRQSAEGMDHLDMDPQRLHAAGSVQLVSSDHELVDPSRRQRHSLGGVGSISADDLMEEEEDEEDMSQADMKSGDDLTPDELPPGKIRPRLSPSMGDGLLGDGVDSSGRGLYQDGNGPMLLSPSGRRKRRNWSQTERAQLQNAVTVYGTDWKRVAAMIPGRDARQCRDRWKEQECNADRRKGPWDMKETKKLFELIAAKGTRWAGIAQEMPGRSAAQCKSHYHNIRRATAKQSADGNLTPDCAVLLAEFPDLLKEASGGDMPNTRLTSRSNVVGPDSDDVKDTDAFPGFPPVTVDGVPGHTMGAIPLPPPPPSQSCDHSPQGEPPGPTIVSISLPPGHDAGGEPMLPQYVGGTVAVYGRNIELSPQDDSASPTLAHPYPTLPAFLADDDSG